VLSLAKARADYYLRKLGEMSPREDYYLRGGTATGTWRGSGAKAEGLHGTVSAEELVRLFDGRHPGTGDQLGRRLRKGGVAAWDVTFSADKSVSLLWALGGPEIRRHVLEAFEEATGEALAYLESVASSTRGAARKPVLDEGGNPVRNDDGIIQYRVETWPIRTHGYLAAWFTEFTSRENDPQIHTHVVVANRVQGVDGKWRALDGQLLYRHQKDASYLHEAELRRQLTERLGVRWQPVRKGLADIEGFTRSQLLEFSRRRQQIEAWVEAEMLPPSAAAYEAATLATRQAKGDHPVNTLMSDWQERALLVGLTFQAVAAMLDRSREITAPDTQALFAEMTSAGGLTKSAPTFGRSEVIQALAEALPEGGTRQQIEALADQFLTTSQVVPILHGDRAGHRVPNLGGLTEEQREIVDHRVAPHGGTRPGRRRDGTLHSGLAHERRYTTAELLAKEQAVVTAAIDGIDSLRFTVPRDLVDEAVRRRPHLTGGQVEMLRRLATSGDAIEVTVGVAGAGKTTVMDAVRELADATGTPIVGAALSGRAAAELQAATAILSFTIVRLLAETQRPAELRPGTVVVVDEAAMVGTRHLKSLAHLVEQAQGKLILIGDDHQLAEIDAGGLFTALTNRLPVTQLTDNVRQQDAWERHALAELRHGSASKAIEIYRQRDRIVTEATPSETLTRAVDDWHAYITATDDLEGGLLIAHDNMTVRRLNADARALMTQSDRLVGPVLQSRDRDFQAGDRVLCHKNHPRFGVLNGDLGTVTATHHDTRALTVRLDRQPEPVRLPVWYLDDGHLDHGYAITCHKAQGATVERAFVVAGGSITREWAYVAMSRGRAANTMYLAGALLIDDCDHLAHERPHEADRLAAILTRIEAQTAAIDTGTPPQPAVEPVLTRPAASQVPSRRRDPFARSL
jgi:hypothetical protein